MDSTVHVPASETPPFWTNEKHVHFLNTMEASFVHTMLNSNNHHHHHSLRLDRHLPDSSESTLDLKSHHRHRTGEYHANSDSMGPKARTTRRRSSHPCNSSKDQVVPQVESLREGAACNYKDEKSREFN